MSSNFSQYLLNWRREEMPSMSMLGVKSLLLLLVLAAAEHVILKPKERNQPGAQLGVRDFDSLCS
jgi:hypothetical protein